MGFTHQKPARIIFLVGGIVLVFMAVLSSAYSYFYFKGQVVGLGSIEHLDVPLVVLEILLICTVLGLLGGLAIGVYVEAWRAKKEKPSSPP
jgi:hypothetical protein